MPHSKTRFCICAALSPLCRATTYNCDIFPISGASAVRANGINSSGIAVGYYTVGDPTTNNHTNCGFILNVNTGAIATITYPAGRFRIMADCGLHRSAFSREISRGIAVRN
jgi:hypothetical protein